MSLQYFMRAATGGSFVNISGRCRKYKLDVKQNAEEGSVAISTLVIDDPNGDLEVGGWKVVYILETDAEDPDQSVVYVGHITPVLQYKRGPYYTGAAREIHVQLADVNNMLNRRILIGKGNDRSSESDVARVNWVLSTAEGEIIGDTSMVTATVTDTMDENDYLLQETFNVYNDCAQQTGNNFFLTHKGGSGPYPFGDYALFYDKPGSATYPSDHRLTNLLADIDAETTFWVAREPVEFTRDFSRVASGIAVPFQESYVFVQSAATADEFAWRDLNMPAINVKNRTTALRRANRYLRDAGSEEHRATLQFITPRAKVNAIREGMTVEVKMTHWPEPYRSEYTAMRVLTRQITDISEDDDNTYLQTIEVSRSTATSGPAACTNLTATGSHYPLGGSGTVANVSDGFSYYLRAGIDYPTEPDAGHQGVWHFPVYGAGGSGTVDQAGDCGGNTVRCMVVGDGSISVHTSTVSSSRNLIARLCHADTGVPGGVVVDEYQEGTTGDTFTFDVSTHGGVFCTHWVDVGDTGSTCGGKWGYSGFDWTAA